MVKKTQIDKYKILLTTFRQWKDTKTDEEIIKQIYNNRHDKLSKFSKKNR